MCREIRARERRDVTRLSEERFRRSRAASAVPGGRPGYASRRHTWVSRKHTVIPIATGSRAATVVQRALRVSL